MERSKNEIIRRYFVLFISQVFIGVGIAFTKHPEIGISPISSVPLVFSKWNETLSFGGWLIVWNLTMVLMQIIILRKDFGKVQFLQIPLSFVSGIFSDAGAFIANRFPVDTYAFKIMCIFIGFAILAMGISMSVVCDVILSPGEGIVRALAQKTKIRFGSVKIFYDSFCVLCAVIMSLIFFDMQIVGVREGSLLSAFFTGTFVKLMIPLINDDLTNWFKAAG